MPETIWTITDETENYLGFVVQKATGHHLGRDYIAWFTSEIPVSDGPRRLNGLPGLILKAESIDGFVQYSAMNIKLHNSDCKVRNPLSLYPDREIITVDQQGKRKEKHFEQQEAYLQSKSSKNSSIIIRNGIEIR